MSSWGLSVELDELLGAAARLARERGRDLADRELVVELARKPPASPRTPTFTELVAAKAGGIEPDLMVALASARLLASNEGRQTAVADFLRAMDGERAGIEARIPLIREMVERRASQSPALVASGCFDGICDIVAEFIVRRLARFDAGLQWDDLVSQGVGSAIAALRDVEVTAPIEKKRKAVVMAVGISLLHPDSGT